MRQEYLLFNKMAQQAKTTIDFGAWPGSDVTTKVITGQTSINSSTNIAEAWFIAEATSDHSVDEHKVAASIIGLTVSDIVTGTGFTINAVSSEGNMYGQFTIGWVWN